MARALLTTRVMRLPMLLVSLSLVACGARVDPPDGTPDSGTDAAPGSTQPSASPTCTESLASATMPGGAYFGSPRPATQPADVTCAAASKPLAVETVVEMQALLVGRWVSCAPGWLPADGIDIAPNGSFALVRKDASGTFVRTGTAGRVKVMKHGPEWGGGFQVDFEMDGGSAYLTHPSFTAGDQRLTIDNSGKEMSFARAKLDSSSPTEPSTGGSEGCSLVGVWESQASSHGTAPGSSGYFRFDAAGAFIGAPIAATCSTPTMKGTYRLERGIFEIITSEGMGCPSSYAAGWSASFATDCQSVTLTPKYDNCTGARHSITDRTVLTRKL